MGKLRKLFSGGSAANEQLTAVAAMLLLALLAVEGATLLNVRSLLTVHAFLGILLIPVIAMKLASTSWRMLRYYRGVEEYVLRGPPHIVLRMIVAPILIGSTITLFGTGVWLLAVDQTEGTLVGLHKASFVVWAGAFGLHLLHRRFPLQMLVPRIGNLPARHLAGYERAFQLNAEPLPKFPMIGQRTPDLRYGCLKLNLLFNAVIHGAQPPGCILSTGAHLMQPLSCIFKSHISSQKPAPTAC